MQPRSVSSPSKCREVIILGELLLMSNDTKGNILFYGGLVAIGAIALAPIGGPIAFFGVGLEPAIVGVLVGVGVASCRKKKDGK